MADKIDYQEIIELEIKALKKELGELQVENSKLKEVIEDNGLSDEIVDVNCVSVEEVLCMQGIRQIAAKVEAHDFEKKDVESFEKLFNVLMSIRGKAGANKGKVKDKEVAKLLKMVEQGE